MAYSTVGSSDFEFFLITAKLHVVLDGRKTYKTVSEKAFFFILWYFYLFWFLYRKIWKMTLLSDEFFFIEIGHIWFKKIENFYADLKNANLP
jgi:hypothetical protein